MRIHDGVWIVRFTHRTCSCEPLADESLVYKGYPADGLEKLLVQDSKYLQVEQAW